MVENWNSIIHIATSWDTGTVMIRLSLALIGVL